MDVLFNWISIVEGITHLQCRRRQAAGRCVGTELPKVLTHGLQAARTNPTLLALRAADTSEGEVQAFRTLANWKSGSSTLDNHIETGVHSKIVGIVHVLNHMENEKSLAFYPPPDACLKTMPWQGMKGRKDCQLKTGPLFQLFLEWFRTPISNPRRNGPLFQWV